MKEYEYSVKLADETEKTAMLAVQGPRVIEKIGEFSREIPTLKNYSFTLKNLLILKMTVSRTGYSGEDGVEVILGAGMANMAIKLLLKEKGEAAAIKPAGLGARDSLRLEAGMPLYGHELSEDTDPLSAGLGFAVSLSKHLPDPAERQPAGGPAVYRAGRAGEGEPAGPAPAAAGPEAGGPAHRPAGRRWCRATGDGSGR